MITAVSSEADEKNSILEWLDRATRVARDTHWASRADGHPDGCPTEGGQVPDGRQVSGGGPTAGLGGGPTGEYISAAGPHF
jgi:hypothetical protein